MASRNKDLYLDKTGAKTLTSPKATKLLQSTHDVVAEKNRRCCEIEGMERYLKVWTGELGAVAPRR